MKVNKKRPVKSLKYLKGFHWLILSDAFLQRQIKLEPFWVWENIFLLISQFKILERAGPKLIPT